MLAASSLIETYRGAWGEEPPRPFQLEVAEVLLNGSGRVVLRAPTGSGKTRAALLAPLAAWRSGQPIADRVLYAVPLRSLATSLANEARRAVEALRLPLRITVQMGGAEEDPLFERGHIIFTTIDQLLSRYLALPYSLGHRRANMCPGALLGSLIVLDEIHLLEHERALSTSLVMLARHFQRFSRFALMSATLSSYALEALGRMLDAATHVVSADEAAQWPGFADIERRVHLANHPVEAPSLLAALGEAGWPQRVLTVLNTVDRAQRLYAALRQAAHPYEVGILHSRYLATDRRVQEDRLLQRFGRTRSADTQPSLLIATQVIEVGLDLSCDHLYTELAPANALVQRFGRCARWPGERGTVVVHPLPLDEAGRWRLGPYREERAAVKATLNYLKIRDGTRMDALAANAMVDDVHGNNDRLRFGQLDLDAVEDQIVRAVDEGELAMRRERIRDVDAIQVLVTDGNRLPDPRRVLEWVSVPRTSLYRLAALHSGVTVWIPDFDETASGSWGVWRAAPLTLSMVRSAFLLLLPRGIATYDPVAGLGLGSSGVATPIRERPEVRRRRYGYQRETYLEHVSRVLRSGKDLEQVSYTPPDEPDDVWPGMATALSVMDRRLAHEGVSARLCRLGCVLHDVGKLGMDWQRWAAYWQQAVDASWMRECLAHTTFDPERHAELESQLARSGCRRPPHALASALACVELVEFVVDCLLEGVNEVHRDEAVRAVLSAIGRHHSPRASQAQAFHLVPEADALVRESLRLAGLPVPEAKQPVVADVTRPLDLVYFEQDLAVRLSADRPGGRAAAREAMALYWLLVRYLRTADGHSQALARVGEV